MSYKLLDENNVEVNLHDLQDKGPWCKIGASFEEVFVEKYGSKFNVIINPEKKTNKYAPDLFNTTSNKIGDLKTQNTPFFQAQQRFNLNPQYTITFNVKDYKRYCEHYPQIEIYFWVKWIATAFENNNGKIVVSPMEGIWRIEFQHLIKLCKESPVHSYSQRVFDDKGNAKDSYVLNLNHQLFNRLL